VIGDQGPLACPDRVIDCPGGLCDGQADGHHPRYALLPGLRVAGIYRTPTPFQAVLVATSAAATSLAATPERGPPPAPAAFSLESPTRPSPCRPSRTAAQAACPAASYPIRPAREGADGRGRRPARLGASASLFSRKLLQFSCFPITRPEKCNPSRNVCSRVFCLCQRMPRPPACPWAAARG